MTHLHAKNTAKKVLLGATTILAVGVAAQPADAATTGVAIQAIILDPVQITANQSLNFGSLTDSGAGGTATVDNAGAISVGGATTSIGGTIQQGLFTLKGSTGRQIDITAPASVLIASGGDNMTVDQFTINGAVAAAATPFTHSLAAATETGFDVGARLTVGAGQAAGTYTGTVTLTANYN